ncbi:cytochrome P450 [Colletotrichum orchidophilum]|uniref:Cytochrome P450 n=1 Tax=Colletotrichum orchidophilum TaxID=1209926 RepID=A0A1G4AQW9_9PEZI|nr:cytochrome P450 [Colletotrichum orchidophilum]OHE91568.1 cytochrome P450 [Colletotrichum orchidophilum]
MSELFAASRRYLHDGNFTESFTIAASFIVVIALYKLVPSLVSLYRWKEPKVRVPVLNLGEDKNYAAASEKYVHNFKAILQQGWERFRDGVYQVWGIDGFVVIVAPKFVEELNAKGTDVVDVHAASQTRIIGDYEWLRIADHLLFHSVQTDLTRQVGALIPGMREEVKYACSLHLPDGEEWTSAALWPRMIKIMALAVSRMTVGPDLSRDETWLATMVGFLDDLFAGGWALKAWSRPLRPLAAGSGLVPGIRNVWKRQATARDILIPIIKQRRTAEAVARASGKEWERPNDLLQWMTDNAAKDKPPKSDGFVAEMCLVSGFGSLHASGVTLTNAVLDLAAMPEYQEIIRLENQEARKRLEPNMKESAVLGSLTRLDSFLKESQRVNPTTLTAFSRQVMKPVTLSNGVHLPEGTHILSPSSMVSWDPEVYSSPEKFDGLRFHNKRMSAADGSAHRNQFTGYSSEQLHFGFGRQACPGRFFGSAIIKLILLYLVDHFDLELVDKEAGRPQNDIKGAMITPREEQEICFRRRKL